MTRTFLLIICFLALTGTAVAGSETGYNALYQWQLRRYNAAHVDLSIQRHELLQKRMEEARALQQKFDEIDARRAQMKDRIEYLKGENQDIVDQNAQIISKNAELTKQLAGIRQQQEDLIKTLKTQEKENAALKDHLVKTREVFRKELESLYTKEEGVLDEHIGEIKHLKEQIDQILEEPAK